MLIKIFIRIFRRIYIVQNILKIKIRILYYQTLNPNLKIGKCLKFGKSKINIIPYNAEFIIGNNVQIRDYCVFNIGYSAKIFIDNNVFFNNFCSINSLDSIFIGSNTSFGEGVRIYDHNHKYSDANKSIQEQGYSTKRIQIGKNCWIGSNVIILKGVTIGDNVVIGANCLIYKDLPNNTIVKNNSMINISSYLF